MFSIREATSLSNKSSFLPSLTPIANMAVHRPTPNNATVPTVPAMDRIVQHSDGQGGEKGLGSTVIGGAAGGYVAHQMGGGKLATTGGAVLGAVGINMVNHKLNKPNPPPQQVTYVQAAPAPGTVPVMVVPADGGLGLGSGLGVGSGLGLGSRLGFGHLGRAHRVIGRRRLEIY
ncbi:uncharacterized protein KD926_009481 [Aspergillus affinis]|uniref:uncharacterized protein n=1 Tax=Aspergillus affinis TaxID=1070780 RepID=UPI0022FDDF0F|nr:uncharacterized protein KD926_009481 [Aspergillus affinis]KAI9039338.1 hypothetical protein KD926_009481 [Aspergillus affinis]